MGLALVLILTYGVVLVVRPGAALGTMLFGLYWPLLVIAHLGITVMQVLERHGEETR